MDYSVQCEIVTGSDSNSDGSEVANNSEDGFKLEDDGLKTAISDIGTETHMEHHKYMCWETTTESCRPFIYIVAMI